MLATTINASKLRILYEQLAKQFVKDETPCYVEDLLVASESLEASTAGSIEININFNL
jgi:hypothetical protein